MSGGGSAAVSGRFGRAAVGGFGLGEGAEGNFVAEAALQEVAELALDFLGGGKRFVAAGGVVVVGHGAADNLAQSDAGGCRSESAIHLVDQGAICAGGQRGGGADGAVELPEVLLVAGWSCAARAASALASFNWPLSRAKFAAHQRRSAAMAGCGGRVRVIRGDGQERLRREIGPRHADRAVRACRPPRCRRRGLLDAARIVDAPAAVHRFRDSRCAG